MIFAGFPLAVSLLIVSILMLLLVVIGFALLFCRGFI